VRVFNTAALTAYLLIFLALVAAGLGAPIPEELPILTAGGMVGHAAEPVAMSEELGYEFVGAPGIPWAALALEATADARDTKVWKAEHYERLPLRWWIMLPICILGVVISDGLLYGVGRFWGPKLLETRWLKRMLADHRRAQIEENFQRYGVLVLLFARFLPAIRSPIFIMAGVTRVSFTRFLLADGIYAIPGVTLLFTLAFWFGDTFRDLVLRTEGKLKNIVILGVLVAIAVYLFYHFFRHPVATGDPEQEMPVVGPQIASTLEASGILRPSSSPDVHAPTSETPPDTNHKPPETNHKPHQESHSQTAGEPPASAS
jgi:membrane protein DedA with SNARE-associated domain